MVSYKVGVTVRGEEDMTFNALRFATRDEAHEYGQDLYSRWTLVETVSVHESDDAVNYAVVDGKLKSIA